jgi:protein gp37
VGDTKIEWTRGNDGQPGKVWNPVRGCTKISVGCKNCYAERFAERWRGIKGHPFEQGFDLRLVPEALDLPLHWRKPRRVFVDSMSDLFHPDVPFEFIAAVFGVMATCPQHIFLILTKRPRRMREWFSWLEDRAEQYLSVFPYDSFEWIRGHCLSTAALRHGVGARGSADQIERLGWPLPNVWSGVSVENQETADERIPILLDTPAAHRFVSAEPLLGPIDLQYSAFNGADSLQKMEGLNWIIVGGESGPGARPCKPEWIRSVIQQCKTANTALYVKQLGSYYKVNWIESLNRLVHVTGAGRDPSEWPEDLRCQTFPEEMST